MAWRVDEYVVRGEIDNRTPGTVTGLIWFFGRPEPVTLSLAGNAWRDLAGRKLEFVNPAPKPGLDSRFAAQQSGQVGDLTASRKVKVPEIPMDQIGEYYAADKSWSWHWGNSLYLEWFSLHNGRVVVESASYQLTVSPESAWEMTAQEETIQREANADALTGFMQRFESAMSPNFIPTHRESPPMTEAEAEKLQNESDRVVDRIMARMDREGEGTDLARIVEEENERARRERGEPTPTPEEVAEHAAWIADLNAASAEALEQGENEPWKEGGETPGAAFEIFHPLAAQSFELSVRVMRDPIDRGWLPQDARPEHPLLELAMGVSNAGANLASALDNDWPPPLEFCAMTIVQLKKAAGHLEDADLAAQSCWEEWLTDAAWLEGVTHEITSISNAISELIDELRIRLNPDAQR